jgi:hypothetical protein
MGKSPRGPSIEGERDRRPIRTTSPPRPTPLAPGGEWVRVCQQAWPGEPRNDRMGRTRPGRRRDGSSTSGSVNRVLVLLTEIQLRAGPGCRHGSRRLHDYIVRGQLREVVFRGARTPQVPTFRPESGGRAPSGEIRVATAGSVEEDRANQPVAIDVKAARDRRYPGPRPSPLGSKELPPRCRSACAARPDVRRRRRPMTVNPSWPHDRGPDRSSSEGPGRSSGCVDRPTP